MKSLPILVSLLTALPVSAIDLAEIVDPNAKVTKLGGEMKFTEGPVWVPSEKKLIFSDIPNSILMEWSAEGGLKKHRDVQNANGNLLDLEGRLLTCQHSGRNVIRTEKDGTITVLAEEFEGKKLNSPNDLAVRSDGMIFFTDPSYGLGQKPGEIGGKWVYQLDPNKKTVEVIYKGHDMPNGIAFSPDEKMLYIADTGKVGKVRAFHAKLSGLLDDPIFEIDVRCDGMCVDVKGNLYLRRRKEITYRI